MSSTSALDSITRALVAAVQAQVETWLADIVQAQKCSIDDLELAQRPGGLFLVNLRGREVGRMNLRLPVAPQ